MEAEIGSLQDALISTIAEKEETIARNEFLCSELETFADKMSSADFEINSLKEEISMLVCTTFSVKLCLCFLHQFLLMNCKYLLCRCKSWLHLNPLLEVWKDLSIPHQKKKKKWHWYYTNFYL